jgi:cytochrome c-type biogenesis protein CcmF
MQIVIYENADAFHLLLISLAIWIFIVSIVDLLPRDLSNFRIEFSELKRKNLPIIGSRITHMAFGIMIFGIIYASAYSENKDIKMNLGDIIQIDRFELQYDGFGTHIGENYDDLKINFTLLKDDKKIANMTPAKRFFRKSGDITTEASIQKYYFDHVYVTVGEVQEKFIYASVSYKPFVRFIWLGGFLMAFGVLLKTLFRSKIFGTTNV